MTFISDRILDAFDRILDSFLDMGLIYVLVFIILFLLLFQYWQDAEIADLNRKIKVLSQTCEELKL